MRQSVYLRIAVFFIRLDVQREDAAWRRDHRRVTVQLPNYSAHLLQDIGVEKDGRIAWDPASTQAVRKARHLRREYKSRLVT